MPINMFPIRLEQHYLLSPSVRHFVFRRVDTEPFPYIPGQFITVHFEHEGKTLRRSYSIANAPQDNNLIEFAAGYVKDGVGTQFLFGLNPNDVIQISGPYGRLTLKDELPKRYVFIATSTGITPYRAMLPELKRRLDDNPELNIVFLQGVQKQQDILYEEEFMSLVNTYERVKFYAYLSRENNTSLPTHQHHGRVQSAFDTLALNSTEDIVYLCGNPGMIDDSFALLKESGFTTQQVIREKYISS